MGGAAPDGTGPSAEGLGTPAEGTGGLWLVPTPIGHLEDMTFRAVRVLKEADRILAEDTRVTRRLLDHYGIDTPLTAYHQHNEHRQTPEWVARMGEGLTLALVTDAGTPGISDPGFLLARACRAAGLPVSCLPGPTAFVPALAASGIPCDRFVFEGFLPPKKGRATRIAAIAAEPRTTVLYESPHRLVKTLTALAEACGPERQAGVFRELSKRHEEHVTGTLAGLAEVFGRREAVKGEIVVVLAGAEA